LYAIALDEFAKAMCVSPRTLQRRFTVHVGISPKLLARIRRFQRVLSAWREDPGSLARVAVECGYFDQSHLIRDFRDFAGAAPAAFLANQPEFTQLFLPTKRPEK
jgi:transcriptional regulator GlxA family with amidase domain